MTVPVKFKNGCVRAGIALILIFLFRIISDYVSDAVFSALYHTMADTEDPFADLTLIKFITQLVAIIILYGGCMITTAWALDFRLSHINKLYTKPKRLGKAVSWAVPCYGAGQAINLLVIFLAFTVFNDWDILQKSYSPIVSGGTSSNVFTVLFMVFQVSIMAPLLEELWFRGIIQTKLADCGYGFSIMISAFAFALAHGNIQQFCYTFVIGLFLGYVRYASGSLIPTTIIHFIINSIAAVLLVMISNETFINAMNKSTLGVPLDNGESALITALGIYVIIVIIIMIVGVFAAIGKLRNRRLYRPINNYPVLSKGQKFSILIKTPDFLVGTALCITYMTGLWASLINMFNA